MSRQIPRRLSERMGKAWLFIINAVLKDEKLLQGLVEQDDLPSLHADLKHVSTFPPDVIEEALRDQWFAWCDGDQELGDERTIGEVLCFLMTMMAEAIRKVRDEPTIH